MRGKLIQYACSRPLILTILTKIHKSFLPKKFNCEIITSHFRTDHICKYMNLSPLSSYLSIELGIIGHRPKGHLIFFIDSLGVISGVTSDIF